MKILFLSLIFAITASGQDQEHKFTPAELATLALTQNPELRFFQEEMEGTSSQAPVAVPYPLDFPNQATLRKAMLDRDRELASLALEQYKTALVAEVQLTALEYLAAARRQEAALDLTQRTTALIALLQQRPAAGIEAALERRILTAATWPQQRAATEAKIRMDLLRRKLNGLLGRAPLENLAIGGVLEPPKDIPEQIAEPPKAPLPVRIRDAQIDRGLSGLNPAREAETFGLNGWFTRGKLGETDSAETPMTPTSALTGDQLQGNLKSDARAKWKREAERRLAALRAAAELAGAMPAHTVADLAESVDAADRHYRTGSVSLNLLLEMQREYFEALETRDEAVLDAWRNWFDLQLLQFNP